MAFIVKVPGINGLGKTQGCERAGNAIIEELRNIRGNENGIPIDVNLLDLEEIHLDNSNLELTNKLIYENALETFETKPKTIFLGGDHSISYSLTKAFLDYCRNERKKPYLIVFDSHADCMPPMKEPTHEEWLRGVIEKGFPKENVMIIGARNIWKDESVFLKENKIKTISINALNEDIQEMCDLIMEFANKPNSELYVSIDIDVLDPSVAPSTGYPEPGGLTSRQFLYLIQRINKIKNLKAIDLVEINEKNDKDKTTIKLGAKIVAELL